MTRYVDTNILVRLITHDVPALSQEALQMVKEVQRGELVILDAIFVELFFVLEANMQYRYSREDSVVAFEGLNAIPQFKISEHARAAFEIFKLHKKLDFMDCLLIVTAGRGRSDILTFDKKLLKVAANS